ncbi:ClbS/DfsB family four-helix bundle protein [Aggregatibacter actinomycetemcomitans]|nr:ClbS/DfsB family four-helix bundle protein [Aggregatibacter actinomycetemcomitans]
MKHYQSKAELTAAIQAALDKYLAEFADIPETARHSRAADGSKTPSEHLAYQLGWVSALLDWERREQAGEVVQTPADGYKWNALGGLYQHFYHTYGRLTLAEQQTLLREKVAALCAWIDSLSDGELFLPGQRQWATTAAQWPLWKWIHINTVAPFTNFRTQIRKWKKEILREA